MRIRNLIGRAAGQSLSAGALLSLLAWTPAAVADPIEQTTELRFLTRGQSLFGIDGRGTTRTEELRFDVLDEQDTIQRGRVENSQVPLSVATLQVIWQRAIDRCTGFEYEAPVLGTFSPSETECINGEIRRNYCIAPPSIGWSICPNIGDNRQTYVKDLGAGIGQKPTQPAKRPYDFGAIVTMNSDLRLGFEGSYTYDLGSVDVDYSTRATVALDSDEAEPGDIVTINTSYTDEDPYLMTSRYPFFELALDMYAYAYMSVDANYAGVDESNGNQVRSTKNLYTIDSRDNPDAIDGFVPFTNGSERLFGVRIDTSGFTTTVLGNEETIDARYDYHLTYPFSSPEVPAKKAPKYTMPVAFSLADFSFTLPQLDTPAPFGFECGDCIPARNEIVDGALTNTTPVGRRQLIGGITDGNGIVLPFVNDGEQDVDLLRVDVDLDVVTVAANVPLGVVIADPVGVLDIELNLMDLDLATFISADQVLAFRPRLAVELRFSSSTEVRGPGEADFAAVTSKVVDVGEALEFRQPDSAVTITPVYTLRNNEFSNLTQLKISNAIQDTRGQIKIGGFVGDRMEEVLGEDPNFALLQITPTLYDPATIWSSGDTPWALDGFVDLPGLPVIVSPPSSGGGGDGGDGSDGGSGGGGDGGSGGGGSGDGGGGVGNGGDGGGSGGGGSLDIASLLGLLLMLTAARVARSIKVARNGIALFPIGNRRRLSARRMARRKESRKSEAKCR